MLIKKWGTAFVKWSWDAFDWLLKKRHVSLNSRMALRLVVKEVAKEFFHGNSSPPVMYRNSPGHSHSSGNTDGKILGEKVSSFMKKRILVDVSQMNVTNGQSGIQRVVVRMLDAMLEDQRYLYVPIGFYKGNFHCIEYHQNDCSFHVGDLLKIERDDTLLMLDSSWEYWNFFWGIFENVHSMGGKVYAVVYDLIPILQPQYVANRMPQLFEYWLKSAVNEVDGLICISRTVAAQLRDYLRRNPTPQYAHPLKIGHFVLGSDFIENVDPVLSSEIADIFGRVGNRIKFLSVSTLEPRKNYDFMLNVMEKLWERGLDVVYFIVGKYGWKVDALVQRISRHPELNKRLFWFSEVSDDTLVSLYRKSDILLNLSHGEGYGLSLVEGAHYQCSVIASDIPVFREVIADGTTLFCNIDSLDETVDAIAERLESGKLVPSCAKCFLWSDALDRMLNVIIDDHWDYEI